MDLCFNTTLANPYKSASQKIRIMSEAWVAEHMYCPCCGNERIVKLSNNRPVADFFCENCQEIFELKSKNGLIGKKIADGAYETMIERITSNQNPSLLILQYADLCVRNLQFIPKHFFTPNIIEKRPPLSLTAKRAGWTGCNILYSEIPQQGKIIIIHDGIVVNKESQLNAYYKLKALSTTDLNRRGWLMDILQCINKIPSQFFTLRELYSFVDMLSAKYPNNKNVEAKIRQQLQLLRDKGFISFCGNGQYSKNESYFTSFAP